MVAFTAANILGTAISAALPLASMIEDPTDLELIW